MSRPRGARGKRKSSGGKRGRSWLSNIKKVPKLYSQGAGRCGGRLIKASSTELKENIADLFSFAYLNVSIIIVITPPRRRRRQQQDGTPAPSSDGPTAPPGVRRRGTHSGQWRSVAPPLDEPAPRGKADRHRRNSGAAHLPALKTACAKLAAHAPPTRHTTAPPLTHHNLNLAGKQRRLEVAGAVTRPRAAPRHPSAHTAF